MMKTNVVIITITIRLVVKDRDKRESESWHGYRINNSGDKIVAGMD